jgi:zinc transporter 1
MKLGRILLEAVPLYLDLEKVKNDLLAVWLYSVAMLPPLIQPYLRFLMFFQYTTCMSGISHNRRVFTYIAFPANLCLYRVILASLHVCVPFGTTLAQWEKTEQYLQHCFSAYGINHVTISPEMYQVQSESTEVIGKCRSHSQDEFGCAVSGLRKRLPV